VSFSAIGSLQEGLVEAVDRDQVVRAQAVHGRHVQGVGRGVGQGFDRLGGLPQGLGLQGPPGGDGRRRGTLLGLFDQLVTSRPGEDLFGGGGVVLEAVPPLTPTTSGRALLLIRPATGSAVAPIPGHIGSAFGVRVVLLLLGLIDPLVQLLSLCDVTCRVLAARSELYKWIQHFKYSVNGGGGFPEPQDVVLNTLRATYSFDHSGRGA
jgi:hypothetical protein